MTKSSKNLLFSRSHKKDVIKTFPYTAELGRGKRNSAHSTHNFARNPTNQVRGGTSKWSWDITFGSIQYSRCSRFYRRRTKHILGTRCPFPLSLGLLESSRNFDSSCGLVEQPTCLLAGLAQVQCVGALREGFQQPGRVFYPSSDPNPKTLTLLRGCPFQQKFFRSATRAVSVSK